jgi:AcrR family transcriptional regulator
MSRPKRRGRRTGTSDTRAAILRAAQLRFSRAGYRGVSVRAIADDAGVDAALVHHYFRTKQLLFDEANGVPELSGSTVVEALATASPGEAVVLAFLAQWETPGSTSPLAGFMRSAASDSAVQTRLTELIATTFVTPIATAIGRKEAMPKLRASLVAAQLMGLAWSRYVLRTDPLASASPRLVARFLGPSLDALLV